MTAKGLLVVISAPSGGGKTSVIRRVLNAGNGNYRYSISATTRSRRPDEIDGRDYHFLSAAEFEQRRKNNEFVECAEVHGNLYATPKAPLEKWLQENRIVFLDLDVRGGLEVKKSFQVTALLIFLKPPSFESLLDRLKSRKTETEAEIRKRLTRVPEELEKSGQYDYQVLNEDLEKTTDQIVQIIRNYRNQS